MATTELVDDWRKRKAALEERGLGLLLKTVCEVHHTTAEEVCGRVRGRNASRARYALWWKLRHHDKARFSLEEIGRLVGRNHTTVLEGIRVYEVSLKRAQLAGPPQRHVTAA